ncbi:hypothetical protein FA13DRAFT_1293320 [Coprinellus micaceus]|uniref:Uncharacterized protein n=1 Tax=Coprinellus micaceus TaxID=71717 RepID=A0A4Y7SS39_COPMI|nr:hypothetical protein FA13DRAFT_1293320 [Coprinellus micaceus]
MRLPLSALPQKGANPLAREYLFRLMPFYAIQSAQVARAWGSPCRPLGSEDRFVAPVSDALDKPLTLAPLTLQGFPDY